MSIVRTNSENQDFVMLVRQLDAYLAEKDGEEHAFYAQFNKIEAIRHVILVYEGEQAVGCGAIKQYADDTMEVKRMFVLPTHRGKGIASQILAELEKWAKELGFAKCILETGTRQTEAIALYERNQYQRTANYGQYAGVENSVCFEKML
jgi:GNAT superfamily N-acetyltransferase